MFFMVPLSEFQHSFSQGCNLYCSVGRVAHMGEKKVIFWDFDGTLGYRRGGMWGAAMIEALKEIDPDSSLTPPDFRPFLITGFPWHHPEIPHPHIRSSEEWWEPIVHKFKQGYLHFGYTVEQSEQLARLARQKFVQLDRWSLFDDTLPTLDQLSDEGWRHNVVSNHIPELNSIIEHLGLATRMDFVVNSAAIGYEKPNVKIYEYALKVSASPEIVWMVGDNIEADVIGAESVRIKSILVRTTDARARYCGTNLEQVISIINGVSGSKSGTDTKA